MNIMLHQDLKLEKQCDFSQITMDDMPVEILVLIFHKLNWRDLLCGVSRVCKLWRDIASHRSAWKFTYVRADQTRSVMFLVKLLSIAPVLGTLDLKGIVITESILRNMLTSTTIIRNIYVDRVEAFHLLILVLGHLSANLEGLEFRIATHLIFQTEEECILGSMPKLRRLALTGVVSSEEDINRLMPTSPLLEMLDLRYFKIEKYRYFSESEFGSKLIIRNKESLKVLLLPTYSKATFDTVDLSSMTECRCLKIISLPLECAEIVSHLPFIETLTFNVSSEAEPPDTWTRPEHLKELILIFSGHTKHNSIRFLSEIRPSALTLAFVNTDTGNMEQYLSPCLQKLTLSFSSLQCQRLSEIISRNKDRLPNLVYLEVAVSSDNVGDSIPQMLSDLRRDFPSVRIEHESRTEFS